MNIRNYVSLNVLAAMLALCGCNRAQRVDTLDIEPPVISGMKCEFVPAGDTAVIYGKNLAGAKVLFETQLYEQPVEANVLEGISNDTVLCSEVPSSAWSGKIKVSNLAGETSSSFWFRDKRNIIIDSDLKHSTWGGFSAYNTTTGELETSLNNGAKLEAPLPKGCDKNYRVLYGAYLDAWAMNNDMLLQYMSNFDEGGRGAVSIAGLHFLSMPMEDLVLKFECYIPKEVPYKGVRTEIFCGPKDAESKHGREQSVICFWEPWTNEGYTVAGKNEGKDLSKGFYTDGWETITIPLTEFKHTSTTDEVLHDLRMDLMTSVNFSFLQFGKPKGSPSIYMCVDNFRIVPAAE